MLSRGFRLLAGALGSYILFLIKTLCSLIRVEFSHVLSSANSMVDALAKQGVDRLSPFVVCNL